MYYYSRVSCPGLRFYVYYYSLLLSLSALYRCIPTYQ